MKHLIRLGALADIARRNPLDPQAFIDAEIKRLEGARMNHAKRRRLVKAWREWSVKLARTHR